jgi:hypothetical protein
VGDVRRGVERHEDHRDDQDRSPDELREREQTRPPAHEQQDDAVSQAEDDGEGESVIDVCTRPLDRRAEQATAEVDEGRHADEARKEHARGAQPGVASRRVRFRLPVHAPTV